MLCSVPFLLSAWEIIPIRAEVKMAEVKMANVTAAELEERVEVLSGNLDQMFLIIMGCCIFCKYEFSLEITFLLS